MEAYLIVDEDEKYRLEQRPSERRVLEDNGVKIVDASAIFAEGATYKDAKNAQLQPMSESNIKNKILRVKNNLYKNCYTPMLDFAEIYHHDMQDNMVSIATMMGATSLRFFKREKEKQSIWSKITASFRGTFKGFKASANGSIENEYKGEYSIDDEFGYVIDDDDKKKRAKDNRVSKEDLQEWLDKKEIDIEVFPPTFKAIVRDYLRTGEALRDVKQEKRAYVLEEAKACIDLEATIIAKLPSFVAKSRIDMRKEEKKEQEKYQEIIFEIKF